MKWAHRVTRFRFEIVRIHNDYLKETIMNNKWMMGLMVALISVSVVACGDDDAAADPARFCEINTEIDQLDNFTTASPDDARGLIAQSRDLLAEAANVAPNEISAAFRVTADSFREALDYYADADFDVDPTDFEAALESGEVSTFWGQPEFELLSNWTDENCAS
jgi:hypothetical protein